MIYYYIALYKTFIMKFMIKTHKMRFTTFKNKYPIQNL